MKKLIGKIVFASALLFSSHAFAQNKKEDLKFIPDTNTNPVVVAENNGIKALYQMGTLYGRKAFTVEFQNTNTGMAFTTVSWKIMIKETSPYFGRTRELKLKPGQIINLDRTEPDAKPAFAIKAGATINDYKFIMRAHDPVPTK